MAQAATRPRRAARLAPAEVERDIFTEFGQEHDLQASLGSDGSRGSVQGSLSIRRHWKSDSDIRRWQQALTDNSRFDRLLSDVRARWHDNYGRDRAELVQKHNALFRQRHDFETQRQTQTQEPSIGELRKLQQQLRPRKKEKVKKKPQMAFLADFKSMLSNPISEVRRQNSTLPEDTPASASRPNSGTDIDDGETMCETLRVPSQHPADTPESDHKQSTLDLPSEDFATADEAARGTGTPLTDVSKPLDLERADVRDLINTPVLYEQKLPNVELPKTLALFLFRNADRHHTGQPVFLPRMPESLTELLKQCGHACRPLAGPAEALLSTDMQPVRSLLEVRSGGTYLLKGAEGLDAPPSFFAHPAPRAQGLRHMVASQRGTAAEYETGVVEKKKRRALRLPCVGSPPPTGSGDTTWRSDKWEPDPQLVMILSHGGLGSCRNRHYDYGMWPRALSSSRSVEQLNVRSAG